jgi:catechol 2,3-dioxygenase-like lactoylglutathione lyase family enzyme
MSENPTPIIAGTRIGHVHLKVADLDRALGFYCGVLGFEIMQRMSSGAAFISAGGYHHHIGFSVGNLITLPALIVQREFDSRSFGVLISLITAINQITYAFGPGIIGLLRDASGSYVLPFYGCIGLELTAAVLIMIRKRSSGP